MHASTYPKSEDSLFSRDFTWTKCLQEGQVSKPKGIGGIFAAFPFPGSLETIVLSLFSLEYSAKWVEIGVGGNLATSKKSLDSLGESSRMQFPQQPQAHNAFESKMYSDEDFFQVYSNLFLSVLRQFILLQIYSASY